MSRRSILPIAAILLCVAVVSCAPSQQREQTAPGKAQALQTVTDFEGEMRRGPGASDPSRLLSFFTPDESDNDREQRRKLLSDLPSAKDLQFTVTSFATPDVRCDAESCLATVSETRDYGALSARFGRQFDRMFTLVQEKGQWRVQEYKHVSRGNTYVGGLSGSEKYSGFYP